MFYSVYSGQFANVSLFRAVTVYYGVGICRPLLLCHVFLSDHYLKYQCSWLIIVLKVYVSQMRCT